MKQTRQTGTIGIGRAKNSAKAGHVNSQEECPICHGRGFMRVEVDGYEVVRRCRCHREQELEAIKERANIPRKFRHVTLENNSEDGRQGFKPYGGSDGRRDSLALESQARAVEILRELRDLYTRVFLAKQSVDDLHGLMLYGDCGRGKTRLACSLLCDLIHLGLHDVRFVEYNEVFKLIRFSYDRDNELSYQFVLEGLITPKVLVIDDFATEVSGSQAWILDHIGYIINERYSRDLPTVLTSNHWKSIRREDQKMVAEENLFENNPSYKIPSLIKAQNVEEQRLKFNEELRQRVNHRLKSRIREMCLELELEGYDYRQRIGKTRDMMVEYRRQKKG